MKLKTEIILTIIILIGLIIYAISKYTIPEFKEMIKETDIISIKDYYDTIEVKIDNKTNFMLCINKEKQIYHIIFLEESSLSLYNSNIENQSISKSIKSMITILEKQNLLKENSTITLYNYENKIFDKVKEEIKKNLHDKNIAIVTLKNTLSNKRKELKIERVMDNDLISIDLYSKELINNIEEINYEEETDSIYMMLEKYQKKNNIIDQEQNDSRFPIYYIESNNNYLPSTNSWYYIKDSKVIAYIEINGYGYCYKGSKTNKKVGDCNEE